jgi:hypothetical protein
MQYYDKDPVLITRGRTDSENLEKVVETVGFQTVQVKDGVDVASVVGDIDAIEGVKAWAREDIPGM